MIFFIKDRVSGAFITHGPQGFTLTRDRVYALLVDGADPQDRNMWKGIHAITEKWHAKNGQDVDLVPIPVELLTGTN